MAFRATKNHDNDFFRRKKMIYLFYRLDMTALECSIGHQQDPLKNV